MAKRRGVWADLQRERARRQRLEQQAYRAAAQAAKKAEREREQARRAAARQAAQDERERKRLYIEERKAEAADMAADLRDRVEELDSVLVTGVWRRPDTSFASLKHTFQPPPFDPGGLDRPIPAPQWVPPRPPGAMGNLFGGRARYEREEATARQAYERERAQHAAAEADRLRLLEERRGAYDQWLATESEAVRRHNAEIDDFERQVRAGDSDAVARFFTLVLDSSPYPEGFPHRTRAIYRPEPRELVVEYELPPQSVIPAERDYKYVQTRDEIDKIARSVKEIKDRYARLIAQVALRTLHEVFAGDPVGIIEVASFNGHVSTTDPATGQPVRPCLLSVSAEKGLFSTFVLADVDPVACLKKLNALISQHPYDLEAVRPVVDFEALLSQYKFVEGMDAVAGLDSRPDLLDMKPNEFEHFTRQLFETMGMKSWVTQASKDDGVDAVAVNEDPVFGGLCVIQAKRYSGPVNVEAVRALAGVMEDKHATKGIMITTSWVTKDGHAFATRHGRIQIMECEEIKYLCKEHLGLDVLISLPKPPPKRR
ncbi:restriction endonuclease [Actinoallomurus spadix]|uniref:Restriction endonuclease n=1 Tax=Actinoallomurus spadix TaxID=79912 RepID=A0ABN0XK81_9ACTN|nr:restriction endonuclease [Actinoallomurus spadix]MCO5984948.1 restriction endonuclease [Actinoallomurus spadix]